MVLDLAGVHTCNVNTVRDTGNLLASPARRKREDEVKMPIKQTCMVCGAVVWYSDNVNVGIIRASCSQCGHQGLFKIEEVDLIPVKFLKKTPVDNENT